MNDLLEFRVKREMTQRQAAEHCKVCERSWRQWEKDGGPRTAVARERLRQGGVVFSEENG